MKNRKWIVAASVLSAFVLTALVLALNFGGITLNEAHADETHTHCICGGAELTTAGAAAHGTCNEEQVWQAWTSTATLPGSSGYWYLTGDVTLTTQLSIASNRDIHICLNGHTITGVSGARLIALFNPKIHLTLTDCNETPGQIVVPSGKTDIGLGIWMRYATKESPAAAWPETYTTLEDVDHVLNFFNITLDASAVTTNNSKNGMTMYLGQYQTFNMFSGTITGGHSASGGNIYSESNSVINIYGGTLKDGEAVSGSGGNIYVQCPLNIYDAVISGGTCKIEGGNIYGSAAATVTIEGEDALVTGGQAKNGGNICTTGALIVRDATVQNGTAQHAVTSENKKDGGHGGNIRSGSTLILQRAKILGGTATNFTNTTALSIMSATTKREIEDCTITGFVHLWNAYVDGLVIKGSTKIAKIYAPSGKSFTMEGLTEGADIKVVLDSDSAFQTYTAANEAELKEYYQYRNYVKAYASNKVVTAVTDTENHTVTFSVVAGTHAHCICGTECVAWGKNGHICSDVLFKTESAFQNSLVSGNYYLGADVSRNNNAFNPANGTTINLCLSGMTLSQSKTDGHGARFFQTNGKTGVTLNICDCSAAHTGSIQGDTNSNNQGAVLWIPGTNNTVRLYGGTIKANSKNATLYGGYVICVESNRFEMYGGKLDGSALATVLSKDGGSAVHLAGSGKAEIFGGEIVGATGSYAKGTIFVGGSAELAIHGGTISGEGPEGGALYIAGKATIDGNPVFTGTANGTNGYGGALYGTSASNVTISGGTFTGTAAGGGAILTRGTLKIEGGTFSGTASGKGGTVYITSEGKLTMTGGTMTGGESVGNGGNINNEGTATISGGTIEGGQAYSGGNIRNGGSLTVSGTTIIKDGVAKTGAGGNLRQDAESANLSVTGGSFLNGSSLVASEVQNVFLYKGSFNISDGVFDGADDAINLFARENVTNSSITGGYFKGLLGGAKLGSAEAAYISGGYFTVAPEAKLLDLHKVVKPLVTPVEKDGVTYGYGLVKALVVSTSSAVPKTGETGVAALTGAGSIAIGDTVTLTAPEMASGYHFLGWYKDAYSVETAPLQNGAKTITLTVGTDFTADTEYVAAYALDATVYTLKISGSAFTITVGEKVVSYVEGGVEIESGAEVVLTYAGDDSEMDFFGWQNMSGKTLTSSGEYSFTMLKDMEIKANEAAKNVKTIVFTNGSGQVLYTFTESIDALPATPVRVGYSTEWSKTLTEINESEAKYVTVAAVFTKKDVEKYTVTIEDVRGGKDNVSRALDPVDLGSRVLLTAAAYEGYKFAYFKDADEKVLSYTAPVYSIFGKDTTVYAVYVLEEASVVKEPTMNLAATVEETAGGKITKFTATRDIPEGYTLLEHGILYQVGAKTEAQMNYGDSRKAISDATGRLGTVSLNVGLVPNGYSITARGYAIIKNAAGETSYLFSDIITVTAEAANP